MNRGDIRYVVRQFQSDQIAKWAIHEAGPQYVAAVFETEAEAQLIYGAQPGYHVFEATYFGCENGQDVFKFVEWLGRARLTDSALQLFANETKQSLGLQCLTLTLAHYDLEVGLLVVGEAERKKGAGTEAMRRICILADAHRLRIRATPETKGCLFGTTSRDRLVRFFKRFGFVENRGTRKDPSISADLIRDPAPRRAAA